MRLLQAELAWLAVRRLINLWITSSPLLVISDKHLESTRKKKTKPKQTPNFVLSSFIQDRKCTLTFPEWFKGCWHLYSCRTAETPDSCCRRGRNYRRELQELIRDKQNWGQKYLAIAVLAPGALRSLSDPALAWSAGAGARQWQPGQRQHRCAGAVSAAPSHPAHGSVNVGTIARGQVVFAGIPPKGRAVAFTFWGAGLSEVGFCLLQLAPSSTWSERDYPKLFI